MQLCITLKATPHTEESGVCMAYIIFNIFTQKHRLRTGYMLEARQ